MPQIAEPRVLALTPDQLTSREKSLKLYEAALKHRTPTLKRALKAVWAAVGLSGLMAFAWAEPVSSRAFAYLLDRGLPLWSVKYLLSPLVMVLRGALLVESFGYMYHRWFQHLGFWTRRSLVFRRNQRYHWMHHMIIYPIGRLYQRGDTYISSEQGIAWSWTAPGLMCGAAAVYSFGWTLDCLAFALGIAAYAKLVVDDVHSRFHLAKHSYQGSKYFAWLEEIHLLHHWDQRNNFTIVHPAMDWLFGTYLAPRTHPEELKVCLEDQELTVSDLVNWRYLLLEATPAEYALFISEAKKHKRSLRKIGHLMEILHWRLESKPDDEGARELRNRAVDLVNLVGAPA